MDEEDVNFLHCRICGKLLEIPRHLVCLHSFCEKCLETWIAQSAKPENQGLKCKICNIFTPVNIDGPFNAKVWTESLPRNNFVCSQVEREKLTAKENEGNFCQPCFDTDGVAVTATHWCQECSEVLCRSCANFHKKVKHLASHRLHSVGELKEHPEIISKAYELCDIHPDERLETYCYTHDEPCCVRCVVSAHRLCEDVVPIERWVLETQNAQEPSELLQELEKRTREEEERQFDIVKFMYFNEQVTKMRTLVDEHLNKIENQLRDEITRAMETASQNKGNSAVHFAKTYLQKLIKNGTSVHLLASMKPLRVLVAMIDKENEKKSDEMFKLQFNDFIEQFKSKVSSFGHVVCDGNASDFVLEPYLVVPQTKVEDKRPPVEIARISIKDSALPPLPSEAIQSSKKKGDSSSSNGSIEKKPDVEKQMKTTQKNVETKFPSDVSPKPERKEKKLPPTVPKRAPDATKTVDEVKPVDNIAEIERKLKLFIDKHITRVNEEDLERKRNEHIYSFADNDEVFVDSAGPNYAKVDKSKQHSSPREGDAKHKRKGTTRKKAPAPDPEKEKLNAMINSYLSKNEKKDQTLANKKSFYFSNPDIPSSMLEEGKVEVTKNKHEVGNEPRRSKKRRNSLAAAVEVEDEDYDHIDYDSPFLDPSYTPMMAKANKLEPVGNEKTVPTKKEEAEDNFVKRDIESDYTSMRARPVDDTTSLQFQVYSPQSQLKAAETNLNKKKDADKQRTPHKGFFEKAKQKLRFNKKQGKFDVNQTTRDKIFEADPMNEPIYMGTPYEKPVKTAAHEIVPKKQKPPPFEQNDDVMYKAFEKHPVPDEQTGEFKNTEDIKEENPYETSFRLLDQKEYGIEKSNEDVPVDLLTNEGDSLIENLNAGKNLNTETSTVNALPEANSENKDDRMNDQQNDFEILDERDMSNSPAVIQRNPSMMTAMTNPLLAEFKAKVKSDENKKHHIMESDKGEDAKDEINRAPIEPPEQGSTSEVLFSENHQTEPPKPADKPVKSTVRGMNPLFMGELQKRLQLKPAPSIDNQTTDVAENLETTNKTTGIQEPKKKTLPPPPLKRQAHINDNSDIQASSMIQYEAKVRNNFHVQSGNTSITGGVFNSQGKILLIDNQEKKLYMFTCGAECEDVLAFKEKPFDLAVVNNNVVAITFPNTQTVDLVDMIEMKIIKSLAVNEDCFGIDYYVKDLIVRCTDSIKIMNLNGNIMKTFRLPAAINGYVSCGHDLIYYTHKNSLVCLDMNGSEKFVLQDPDMATANGVASDFEGNVYVTGFDSNDIWQISSMAQHHKRKIVSNLFAPTVLAFNDTKNRFLVACDKSNVVIYDLKSVYGSLV